MTRLAGYLTAVALTVGLAGAAGAAPETMPGTMKTPSAADIPVVFTSEAFAATPEALCDGALENVAIGRPVPFRAAGCLRTFLLEADSAATVAARPAPEACEALLPSFAVGAPVLLGAAVPCVEDYILTGRDQVATR
ncbi:hypothetical protein [Rhodospira trueperi]|uniref:Uncharacterized protein n=1 Tax=Rhodospira trueperi TaxID=69960 RepID=A0A1G7FIY0_9PROT|nr:hypothetical protein [Rhodospira trueperi]SDE75828.1 hypothetical protein SAMN05421720_11191 [Rhodospira trueperi]